MALKAAKPPEGINAFNAKYAKVREGTLRNTWDS